MPRNSISRRVARAASIGGSRSYRQRTPMGWYSVLALVCIIGLGLVVYSRHELTQKASATTTTTTTTQPNTVAPTAGDHWQVALSVDVCGSVLNLPKSANQTAGIITSGNGVVDIEPSRAGSNALKYEGANANLGNFLASEDVSLASTSLRLPSSVGKLAGTYADGRKCGTKPGSLQLYIWTSPSAKSPLPPTAASPALNYNQGELYMLAFVAKGASVPKPPAAKLVAAFLKSLTPPKSTTTTTTKSGTTTTTTKSGTTTTTTKSGSATSSTTTTTSAASTTTTKPGSSTSTTG